MAWCSLSHTPAALQSLSRRQQVMPFPQPSDWGEVFPQDACVQHEQDAVEGGFVADFTAAGAAFGGGGKDRDQGLGLFPQILTK